MLLTRALIEFSNMAIIIENEALYDICEYNLGIKAPLFNDVNVITGQVVSSFFASMSYSSLFLFTI